MRDLREGRPLLELADELLDERPWSLGARAHAAVLQVAHVAGEAEALCTTLRKETGATSKFVPLPAKYMDPEKSELSVEVKGGTQSFDIVVPEQ